MSIHCIRKTKKWLIKKLSTNKTSGGEEGRWGDGVPAVARFLCPKRPHNGADGGWQRKATQKEMNALRGNFVKENYAA